ncbi:MAG: ATPase domain-containing protein [Candidatus Aenigmatarchaeota archaeon]
MFIGTGIKKLDKLLGGGFPGKTTVLVSGGPGSGKTLFAMNFLMEGILKKERCCYVSLNETKDELLRASKGIESLGAMEKYVGKNFAIEHIPLGENITMKKFIDIIASYPKIDRLVIDNVNKLLIFAENERSYRIHLSELVKSLRQMGCTLLICETRGEHIDTGNGESFECDGVLSMSFLELEEKPQRIMTIHKMRYASFEPKVPHEIVIDSKEIRITETKII